MSVGHNNNCYHSKKKEEKGEKIENGTHMGLADVVEKEAKCMVGRN